MTSTNKGVNMFQGDEVVLRVLSNPLVRELAKVKVSVRQDVDWSQVNCYVIIGRSPDVTKRSLAGMIEKLCTLFKGSRGEFVGRLAESSTRLLEKTKRDLLEASAKAEMESKETLGVYGPVAGEIRYSSDKIENIMPIFSAWDSADYFELTYVDDQSTTQVKKRLQESAFSCTELYLFELTKSCRFVMRKSGDEDEVEILSTALPFQILYTTLSAIIEESRGSWEVVFRLRT